jgi:endo-alpha-1,4-polygalactosaminidase (GH114 family)
MLKKLYACIVLCLILAACKSDNADPDTNIVDGSELPNDKTDWWKPVNGVSFDWDLDDLNAQDHFEADVVDVDAFTTSAEQVAALHAQGKKVIAYISVGTLENDRPDAGLLPKEVIGKVYPEWTEEKWVDIREPEKLKPWLNSRFRMIINKGFDAIEPDNLDSFDNETGFNITESDTRRYCDFLISLAHQNGLGIGQKNVPGLASDFAAKFDWLLTEDAFEQGWQEQVKPFIDLKKPVFSVEYTDMTTEATFENIFCPKAKVLKVYAVLKRRDLDKWSFACGPL